MKKILMALLPVCCVILGFVFYWMSRQDDTTAPVITFPDETIQYEEGQDTAALLAGVTAVDAEDGDVSDTLMVKSVLPMKNETTATVLYCAKDSKNNVGNAARKVDYIPEGGVLWLLESEGETETEPETEAKNIQMVALEPCNIRAGASTDAEIVDSLDTGETIMKVGETDDGWTEVERNGKTAYIKSELLALSEEEENQN